MERGFRCTLVFTFNCPFESEVDVLAFPLAPTTAVAVDVAVVAAVLGTRYPTTPSDSVLPELPASASPSPVVPAGTQTTTASSSSSTPNTLLFLNFPSTPSFESIGSGGVTPSVVMMGMLARGGARGVGMLIERPEVVAVFFGGGGDARRCRGSGSDAGCIY